MSTIFSRASNAWNHRPRNWPPSTPWAIIRHWGKPINTPLFLPNFSRPRLTSTATPLGCGHEKEEEQEEEKKKGNKRKTERTQWLYDENTPKAGRPRSNPSIQDESLAMESAVLSPPSLLPSAINVPNLKQATRLAKGTSGISAAVLFHLVSIAKTYPTRVGRHQHQKVVGEVGWV